MLKTQERKLKPLIWVTRIFKVKHKVLQDVMLWMQEYKSPKSNLLNMQNVKSMDVLM